jgi:hypothetical protein
MVQQSHSIKTVCLCLLWAWCLVLTGCPCEGQSDVLTLSDPITIGRETEGDSFCPSILFDHDKSYVAIWTERPLPNPSAASTLNHYPILLSRSLDSGQTWSESIELGASDLESDAGVVPRPTVATNRQGDWIAVWQSRLADDADGLKTRLCACRSNNDANTWDAPSALWRDLDLSYDDLTPQVTTDRQGTWAIVWVTHIGRACQGA